VFVFELCFWFQPKQVLEAKAKAHKDKPTMIPGGERRARRAEHRAQAQSATEHFKDHEGV
jgi:hypothetical protein